MTSTSIPHALETNPSPVTRNEVAFVDTAVADWQTLVDGIRPGVEVVLLDGNADGLAQMSKWAETHTGYDAIHIVSHGSEGALHLGTLTLNNSNLNQYSDTLAQIGSALTADGDFLVYGCNVAEGQTGVEFIGKLAQATGADVAASDDLTGAAFLGGDWVLEYATGTQNSSSLDITNFSDVLTTGTGTIASSSSFSNPVATATAPNGDVYYATPVTGLVAGGSMGTVNFNIYKYTSTSSSWSLLTNVNAGASLDQSNNFYGKIGLAVDSNNTIHVAITERGMSSNNAGSFFAVDKGVYYGEYSGGGGAGLHLVVLTRKQCLPWELGRL